MFTSQLPLMRSSRHFWHSRDDGSDALRSTFPLPTATVSNAPLSRTRRLSVWVVMVALAVTMTSQTSLAGDATDFARDIAPILKNRCAECHSGAAPKGEFDVSSRDALMGYIEPGKPLESSLWTDYLTQPSKTKDPKSSVMPPRGPLERSELCGLSVDSRRCGLA